MIPKREGLFFIILQRMEKVKRMRGIRRRGRAHAVRPYEVCGVEREPRNPVATKKLPPDGVGGSLCDWQFLDGIFYLHCPTGIVVFKTQIDDAFVARIEQETLSVMQSIFPNLLNLLEGKFK